jgi:acetyl esterase
MFMKRLFSPTFGVLSALLAIQTSCNGPSNGSAGVVKSTSIRPMGPKPGWGPDIHPEMQAVIEQLESYHDSAIQTLSAVQARRNHTPADAVMALVIANNIFIPPSLVDTVGKEITVEGGTIHLRIYTPKSGGFPLPIIVYYHGGGWVIADINTYNASAQGLAEQTNAIVVAVEYRKAPEHRFPTAINDAFEAYEWVLKNAGALKGDGKKVAVVGESAGGNLAINVSIMARDRGIEQPIYQVLVYPIASNNINSASYIKNDAAKPLNKPMMDWFFKKYAPSANMMTDPRINVVNANLKGLPSTTIITAAIDPLHDDGEALSKQLKSAGIKVNCKTFDGVTHEFFGMAIVVPEAREAQSMASSDLKNAFLINQ